MDEYKNSKVNGIHKSRIIASYLNAGGKITGVPRYDGRFIAWLKTLEVNNRLFTIEEVREIYRYAQIMHSGKLELEISAREFLKESAS